MYNLGYLTDRSRYIAALFWVKLLALNILYSLILFLNTRLRYFNFMTFFLTIFTAKLQQFFPVSYLYHGHKSMEETPAEILFQ